ncbi:hypothetical protein NKG94_45725 [Micromonospora sp. M12]
MSGEEFIDQPFTKFAFREGVAGDLPDVTCAAAVVVTALGQLKKR